MKQIYFKNRRLEMQHHFYRNKRQKYLCILALLAMISGPLLFLCQSSARTKKGVPTEPVLTFEEEQRKRYSEMTMNAFWGNEQELKNVALELTRRGDRIYAEHWLRYGALDLQRLSIFLFYGDFLYATQKRREMARADFWYRQAEGKAVLIQDSNQRKLFQNMLAIRRENIRKQLNHEIR